MPHIKDQSGVLLLLAIVMTTVILTAALVISTLIIREIRVSQISDKGQIALFAAESASEDALFQLLQLGVEPVALDDATGSFSTGATWSRSVSNETNEFVIDYIPANRSEVIYLYNRTKVNDRAEVASLNLSWSSGTSLAVAASTWDGSDLSTLSPLQTLPCVSSCTGSVPLDPTKGYSLVFAAEGTAITDLIISWAPSTNLVETAVTVKVVGKYKGAEQALEIILPEPPPWEESPEAPPVPLACGDGILDAGEDCEAALTPTQACTTIEGYAGDQSCNATTCTWDACVSPENCGDGTVNGTETCEPPDTPICDATCQVIAPFCGDGNIDAGETCDDGNTIPGDGCDEVCQIEVAAVCGDSSVDSPEVCDDGDATDAGTCNATCSALTFCSDGTIQNPNGAGGSEQCDDGNTTPGDGCDAACQTEEYCPNGKTYFYEFDYLDILVEKNGQDSVISTHPDAPKVTTLGYRSEAAQFGSSFSPQDPPAQISTEAMGYVDNFSGTGDWTVCMFVNPWSGVGNNVTHILGYPNARILFAPASIPGQIPVLPPRIQFQQGASVVPGSEIDLDLNTYTFVCYIQNGTTITKWRNGFNDGTFSNPTPGTFSGPSYFGALPSSFEQFSGRIDELGIFEKALNTTELNNLRQFSYYWPTECVQ